MKRTHFISALFLSTCMLFAVPGISQEKILGKSSRKQPEWLGSNEKGFIIVSAKDPNLEGARKKSIDLVRQYMVEAVAVWVESETKQEKTEENKDNEFSISESFKTKTQIESADVHALHGVSISKTSDSYWEKIRNKKDKNEFYSFHLKYPFPEKDLNLLVNQYKEYDNNLTQELEGLLNSISKTKSVEELTNKKDAFKNLSEVFKDYRKEKTILGIHNIESIIKGLRFEVIELTTRILKLDLKSGDKVFKTSAQPKVTSECATILSVKTENDQWIVEYDSDGCYVDDENSLSLSINTGGRLINQKVPVDISKTLIEISVKGEIQFIETGNYGTTCNISIHSEYETPYKIDKLSLEWPKNQPVYFESINREFKGKGLHQLEINLNQDNMEDWQHCRKKYLCMLSGKIWYTNLNTNVQGSYSFNNVSYSIK